VWARVARTGGRSSIGGMALYGVGANQLVLISDTQQHCIRAYRVNDSVRDDSASAHANENVEVFCWGSAGDGVGQYSSPRGLAVTDHDTVVVADCDNDRCSQRA
jgi:hypothetical protein